MGVLRGLAAQRFADPLIEPFRRREIGCVSANLLPQSHGAIERLGAIQTGLQMPLEFAAARRIEFLIE